MKSICLYFQVHQPYRLRTYRFFDIGHDSHYYDDFLNKDIVRRVADNCYLPMNEELLKLIGKFGDAFRFSFSISGSAIDQFEAYAPEVLDSFRKLAATGQVEFLAETYDHSLSSLRSKEEFSRQVQKHAAKVESLFGQRPVSFRNAELLYSDGIGEMVADLGFQAMLTEGAKHILGWKSPNFMYCNAINPKLKVLLRNFNLSDDISFRFAERAWSEWPLTAGKFAGWLNDVDPEQELVNIFLDYETFGEHLKKETGIIDFMTHLPGEVLSNTAFKFRTPKEAARELQPVSAIHVPYPVSWADEERDITAWLGNELQNQAVDSLYALEAKVMNTENPAAHRNWSRLQASDHFHYMSTKWFSAGEVHKDFNPYPGPYEAFINYMNVLTDFTQNLDGVVSQPEAPKRVVSTTKKTATPVAAKRTLGLTDIPGLEDDLIRNLIKNLDTETWGIVCATASKKLKEKLYANLGKRQQANFTKHEAEYRSVDTNRKSKARKALLSKLNILVGPGQ